MKYILCNMGDQFVVGLDGSDAEAAQNANLAHNLFNSRARYDIFNGRINFTSPRQFLKFLIYKEWLNNGQCLRSAAKTARQILEFQTKRVDFMRQLRQRSNNYYTVTSLSHNNHETED